MILKIIHSFAITLLSSRSCFVCLLLRLLEMKVPNSYWAEAAFAAAAYLINRTPTPVTENVSPLQRLTNRVPSYDHLRVFGCRSFVLLPSVSRDKLSPRAVMCIFL
jgi:hypothetical protein